MEWIVGALAVLGFIAIALRFVPRDDAGRAQLPRIIDDSIAMWALRRLTGRPFGDGIDRLDATNAGTRFAASASRLRALGIPPASSVSTRRRPRTVPVGSALVRSRHEDRPVEPFVLQRRVAAAAAALLLAIVGVVVVLASGGLSGGVLDATGYPALGAGTEQPSSAVAVGSNASLPASHPASTPVARSQPPTATATPKGAPKPTPTPTPVPTPVPPVALFAWSGNGNDVQFTNKSTGDIVSWLWTFGDGGSSSIQNPSHTFASRTTQYWVTLTVTDSLNRTSAQTLFVKVP